MKKTMILIAFDHEKCGKFLPEHAALALPDDATNEESDKALTTFDLLTAPQQKRFVQIGLFEHGNDMAQFSTVEEINIISDDVLAAKKTLEGTAASRPVITTLSDLQAAARQQLKGPENEKLRASLKVSVVRTALWLGQQFPEAADLLAEVEKKFDVETLRDVLVALPQLTKQPYNPTK